MEKGTGCAGARGNRGHWVRETKVRCNLGILVLLSEELVPLVLELEEALLALGCVEFCKSGAMVDPLSQGRLDAK